MANTAQGPPHDITLNPKEFSHQSQVIPSFIGSGTFPVKLLSTEILSISPDEEDTRMEIREPLFNSN